jgi:hypothetical protein
LIGKLELKRPSENLGVSGRIILRWILRELGLGLWIGFIGLRIGTGGGLKLTR